jgi:hypothetical protein
MPFTFSHPAIILPLPFLSRNRFSLTGLVIGSMTPDFEYFIRMKIQSSYSHSVVGLFWFDLPLGILLAFIFHNIVRDSLFENLPFTLKSRFFVFTKFKWNTYFINNWFVVLTSILIGAISHIIWDGFTHGNGYFVERISFLMKTVDLIGIQIPIFKILQHSSSLAGGIIIMFTFYKLPIDNSIPRNMNLLYWLIFTGLLFVIVTIRFSSGFDFHLHGNIIVSVISAALISLILTPLVVNWEFPHS